MSEEVRSGAPVEGTRELPGFFGAGEPLPADEIAPRVWEIIDTFLETNPGGQERLIPLLHRVQEQLGYLPFTVQEHVAERLGMSPVQVYGVVSFYHFFTTTPRGRYQLKVCTGTACFVRRSQRLINTIRDVLNLEVGGVTDDHLFSLEEVRCLGACGLAPALMVNNAVHGNMTAGEVRKRLRLLSEQANSCTGERESGGSDE